MRQFCFLSVVACCLFSHGCFNNNPKAHQSLPIVDLTKKYPEKDFLVDDDNIEYIPLETTNEALADEYFFIKYVSNDRIVAINGMRGDIFVFDREGKVVSFFNHKGNSGIDYYSISSLVFDENRKEIFVSDHKNQCLVYSEEGKFLRQFYHPVNSDIGYDNLYNFDNQTLFAYNRHSKRRDADEINQVKPYVFLSKEDGSVISRLDVSFPERIPDDNRQILGTNNEMVQVFTVATTNIVESGQEFIITDRSSDTVYFLTQEKKLTPLFVRTPSVFDTKRVIYLSVKNKIDSYIFFSSCSYDFTKIKERLKEGLPYSHLFTTNNFVFDMQTGEIFTPVHFLDTHLYASAPANTVIRSFKADRLTDWLEEGRLEGRKIKQVAQVLKEEDNPVVEIIKYR